MKRAPICFILVMVWVGVVSGQATKERVTQRVVPVPPEIVLPLIAYQPDCPLQIEDIKLFRNLSGDRSLEFYKVRNKGTKPIRSYTIGAWNSVGTGSENERPFKVNLLPGHVASEAGNEVEVVELTESLRNKLNLRGAMRAVVVFMIVRVEYADGSVYETEPAYKALKEHLDNISQ